MHVVDNTADKIAAMLLEIGAIRFNTSKPFQWASGWKSPIYCDNRLSLSYPDIRSTIKLGLAQAVQSFYPTAEGIAGVATAGIPQGALVADGLGLPFLYVRSKPKEHGLENLVEGRVLDGQKLVVVEDLVSTGGSSLKVVEALRKVGADPMGMIAIFSYGLEEARKNFEAANLSLVCLTDYGHLLKKAVEMKVITEEEVTILKAWRVDPANWMK